MSNNTPAGGVTLPELLPCPMCGGDAAFNRTTTDPKDEMAKLNKRHVGHGVNCVSCGLSNRGMWIGYASQEKAAAAWNTRAALAGEWRAPEGWRLVPVEATEAMLHEGAIARMSGSHVGFIYTRMLSAAPLPKEPGR